MNTTNQLIKKTTIILGSPWTIIAAIILGVFLGMNNKGLAQDTAIVGTLYLNLFKMCVLPILTSGIIASLGRLMQRHDAAEYIKKILVVFSLSLIILSSVSVTFSMAMGPGKNLDTLALDALGVLVEKEGVDLELSLTGPLPVEEVTSPLTEFAQNLIPSNIFRSLADDNTLQVLFFSIFFGIALGLVSTDSTNEAFKLLDSVYQSFTKVINWLKYLSPFGLSSLIASQIAEVGVETLKPMLKFISISILAFMVVYCINTLVIWLRTRMGMAQMFNAMQEPTFLALATCSSLACLPSAIDVLEQKMRFNKQGVNLLMPLSMTLCRYGNVLYFGLGAIFVIQLYNETFGLKELILIVISVVFAGMATSGVTGILTLTMLGIVLNPLGLPLDAVLVLFIAIDPIMDPFRTLINVQMGMTATALIATRGDDDLSSALVSETVPANLC